MKRRRHSVAEQEFKNHIKDVKFPEIGMGKENKYDKKALLDFGEPKVNIKKVHPYELASKKVTENNSKNNTSNWNTPKVHRKGKASFDGGNYRYEKRPQTNRISSQVSPDPKPLFLAASPLDTARISDIANRQEELNQCS